MLQRSLELSAPSVSMDQRGFSSLLHKLTSFMGLAHWSFDIHTCLLPLFEERWPMYWCIGHLATARAFNWIPECATLNSTATASWLSRIQHKIQGSLQYHSEAEFIVYILWTAMPVQLLDHPFWQSTRQEVCRFSWLFKTLYPKYSSHFIPFGTPLCSSFLFCI